MSLHPAVVLVAIPAGGADRRACIGMFLVVPFLGVIATVWRTLLDPEDLGLGRRELLVGEDALVVELRELWVSSAVGSAAGAAAAGGGGGAAGRRPWGSAAMAACWSWAAYFSC